MRHAPFMVLLVYKTHPFNGSYGVYDTPFYGSYVEDTPFYGSYGV